MEKLIESTGQNDVPIFRRTSMGDFDAFNKTDTPDREITTAKSVSERLHLMSHRVLCGEISVLDSTKGMSILVFDAINKIVSDITIDIQLDATDLPFAVFLFGSPSRNLMLPNSDLDIGLVFIDDCHADIKKLIRESMLGLPFDQVDIAGWSSIEEMKKDNCHDMIEFSKATDVKFIIGNTEIARTYTELIRDMDTRDDKISRFITEFGLFHRHDYVTKRTENGPNLKYDFGASRDIIFLDWYYIINNLDNKEREQETAPFFIKGLDILLERGSISSHAYAQYKSSIEVILLVKFTLRSKYIKTQNDTLLRLNSHSLHECFFEAKPAFQRLGINNVDELIDIYYDAKLSLDNLVRELYDDISISNQELTELWNTAKKTTDLDQEILKITESRIWHKLLPFAIASKSPEILESIVDSIANISGFEYILRIISENKFITDKIRQKLLDSKLADKFKKRLIA